ncbi:MAG TPA: hypothetical protein VGO58_17590 [Chitinophagaceae bacterium]|nr:hypothetical protein [Chitinophagaceae bacterium]
MRQLSAILLTGIFAFSQYARQLSFLECKFSNLFKIAAAKCDCEKQAGFEKQSQGSSPLSAHHLHIHLDEYFVGSGSLTTTLSFNFTIAILPAIPDDDACNGHLSPPWQPPNSPGTYTY